MGYNLIECNREQTYLLPLSLRDWLPAGDLAWFVVDAVGQMNLQEFYRGLRRDGRGGASFPPQVMVTLLVYAYCTGVRSSRQIERLCERDVAFRVITANQVPDHTTIARFRAEYDEALGKLFGQVLALCAKAKLLKVGVLALDGTKIGANASLAANRTHEGIEKEVRKILDEAAALDAAEDRQYGADRRGDELPPELQDRESRLARLRECKEQLEREAAEAAAKQQEKIDARRSEEQAAGKKKRGRKPKEPDATVPKEAKANVTDPGSRVMKTRSGFVQGYNAQAVVDQGQVIVAAEVTIEQNDQHQLHPMVEKAKQELAAVAVLPEQIATILADAGYCSDENLEAIPEGTTQFLVNTVGERDRRTEPAVAPRGRIPTDATARERMDRELRTKRGKALYKRRSVLVEPVFGMIKSVRGMTRFVRRGLGACEHEWKLICATHNLLKLWRNEARKQAAAPA
jgi:transposase